MIKLGDSVYMQIEGPLKMSMTTSNNRSLFVDMNKCMWQQIQKPTYYNFADSLGASMRSIRVRLKDEI